MDPFFKLPPELRVHVLISSNNGQDLQSIIHASPVMFQQFQTSKTMVQRGYLGSWLKEPLLQDAIAVATCPPLMEEARVHDFLLQQTQARAVELHLCRWASKTLPHSVDNLVVLGAVGSCVRKLERYMADYVAKATSSYLPYAYLSIPGYSTRYTHSATELQDPGTTPHIPARLGQLTPAEWERLARGFLRHELVCRAHRAHWATSGSHNPFPEWTLLEEYEEEPAHPRDVDMMECVQEYICTLHGALQREIESNTLERPNPIPDLPVKEFSDCTDSEGHQRGLFAPDSSRSYVYFRHSSNLAVHGLQLFDSIIQKSNTLQKPVVRCYLETSDWHCIRVPRIPRTHRTEATLSENLKFGVWGERRRLLGRAQGRGPGDEDDIISEVGPGNEDDTWEEDSPDDTSEDDYPEHASPEAPVLFSIYEQRAWALFNDDRLYPGGLNFPTLKDVQNQYAQWPGWYEGSLREVRLGYAGDVKYPTFGRFRSLSESDNERNS